ncbi:MmgE/PrpD family protein [Parvibaculaceae bacterium PLY_AMNH_Bact1]|nr:MmgE/PrpD family protein [Parvibaculaceae bacterium PLY_AMNH_Bact1]
MTPQAASQGQSNIVPVITNKTFMRVQELTHPAPSLTRSLVSLIRSKSVTEADLSAAALFVLDAIANTCAGQNSEPGEILLAWSNAEGAANMQPDTGKRAFLLGALTHILETDDLHRQSVVHPGCVVVPPAWILAAKHGINGRAFLTSVLHGFEATTRVGMAVGAEHYRIWHNTATCGPFGSAMAAAALLGLDEDQTTHALGNAGSQAAGVWEFLETGAMTKHLHAGHAAEAGVRAAELAKFGFTGPPKILEGDKGFFKAACPDADPSAVLADADAPWQLTNTSIKPWPSCRHTHPAIDAAQSIRAALKEKGETLTDSMIETIDVGVYQASIDVCDRVSPMTEYEAKFSLHHTVAAGLLYDQVDFAAFGERARTDLQSTRTKVRPTLQEPYASAYPRAWGSSVTLTLKSGETIVETRTHAKGDPEAALAREEMIDKASMLLSHAQEGDPTRFINAVLALADDGQLPTLPNGL